MRRLIAGVLVVAALAVGWWLLRDDSVPSPEAPQAEPISESEVAREQTAQPTSSPTVTAAEVQPDEPTTPAPAARESCWEIEDFDEQDLPDEELALIYSAVPLGPDFEDFRHLDPASLQAIAEQGDSAAMALLGMMAMGEAYGVSPDDVFALILGEADEDSITINPGIESMDEATTTALHEEAEFWFYEAALHGRVGALALNAFVNAQLERDAVSLGWITAEELEAMEPTVRVTMQPSLVYLGALLQLVPAAAAVGPFASWPSEGVQYEESLRAQHRIIEQYHRDLADRGLPRPEILDAELPVFAEIAGAICD